MNEMIDINEKWPNFDGPINKIEGGSAGNIAIKYGITIKVGKNFCPVFWIGGKLNNRLIVFFSSSFNLYDVENNIEALWRNNQDIGVVLPLMIVPY